MNAFTNPPEEFESDIVTMGMCSPKKIKLQPAASDAHYEALSFAQYLQLGIVGGFALLAAWAGFIALLHSL